MADENSFESTAFEIDAIARRGEMRRALELALEAIRKGPADSELYFIAAEFAYRLGDLDKACQMANSLLVCDPQHLAGWYLFGEICKRKSDIIQADHAERTAETLFPALINIPAGAADPDRKNINEIKDKSSTRLDFDTVTFADICASQGYYHKALKIYQDQLRKNPDDENIRRKIEDLEKRLGRNDRSANK